MPYNLPHPECNSDEEWYCNISDECVLDRLPFDSKRTGGRAFNYDGQELGEGYRPVFVRSSELEAKGVDLDAMRAARHRAAAMTIQRRLETPQTKKGKAMAARNKRIATSKAKMQEARA